MDPEVTPPVSPVPPPRPITSAGSDSNPVLHAGLTVASSRAASPGTPLGLSRFSEGLGPPPFSQLSGDFSQSSSSLSRGSTTIPQSSSPGRSRSPGGGGGGVRHPVA
eukprot:RCo021249